MKSIFTLLLLLFFIIAYNYSENNPQVVNTSQYFIKEENIKVEDDFFQVEKVREDLDGDGSEEVIILYLGPISHPESKVTSFHNEDYKWKLLVQDKNKTFPLINQSLKAGTNLDFWFEYIKGQKEIVVFLDGEVKNITSYKYDRENNRFIKVIQYKNKGKVIGFSPTYQKVD